MSAHPTATKSNKTRRTRAHARAHPPQRALQRPDAPQTLKRRADAPPPLAQHPAAVFLASKGRLSQVTYRGALDTIAALLTDGRADALAVEWSALRFQHTAAIRAQLAARYSAATANKMLCALRGTLKTAQRLGQIGADDCANACAVESIKGETLPRGRALEAGEIAALLNACARDKSAAGARDAAIIALWRGAGLRRAEICALQLADYDTPAAALRVTGKRNKQRAVPLGQGAADALADWLAVRGTEPGALFYHVSKAGALVCVLHNGGAPAHGEKLAPQAVYNMLAKRAAQAGVTNLSPHDFRRTFVSDLLDAGADIATVQQLAGHANVQTTARYDRRGEGAKRRAVALLHVPYTRRT